MNVRLTLACGLGWSHYENMVCARYYKQMDYSAISSPAQKSELL